MNRDEHRALREQLGAYALDQLDQAERLALHAHLSGCAECQAELAAIEPVVGPLSRVDPSRLGQLPAPPPDLGDRILRDLRAQRPSRLARAARWTVPVAAVLLIAALAGGIGYRLAPKPPTLPLEPVAVQVVDPTVDATAALVPHTWGVEIKLTATGFEQGVPYRVSITDLAGNPQSAGEFVGTGAAQLRCNLNSSLLRGQATGFQVLDPQGNVLLTSSF